MYVGDTDADIHDFEERIQHHLEQVRIVAQVKAVEIGDMEETESAYLQTMCIRQRRDYLEKMGVDARQSLTAVAVTPSRVTLPKRKTIIDVFGHSVGADVDGGVTVGLAAIADEVGSVVAANASSGDNDVEGGGGDIEAPTLTTTATAAAAATPPPPAPTTTAALVAAAASAIVSDGGIPVPPPSISPSARVRTRASSFQMDEARVRLASAFNANLQRRSGNAELVVTNLPLMNRFPPLDFMSYVTILTKNLPRVLLLRGTGREVITKYG